VLSGIVNSTQLLFSVHTGHDDMKRPPLTLAFVLDRSGSMSGDKLDNAKKAIVKVIEALAEDDTLHLVVYGTKVEVTFENADLTNKTKLINHVKSIGTSGNTNLWGGLEKGAELVNKYKKPGYISRIFLFSDGLVNEGVKDKAQIIELTEKNIYTELDIKVSAFGLGNDFDEEIMKGIADKGRGSYFFIEGSQAIPQFVGIALKGILKLVGSDAVLRIRGLKGSVVSKIYGHKDLIKGAELGDLSQDDVRRVVCELEVKPSSGEKEEEIASYSLKFRSVRKKVNSEELPEHTDSSKKEESSEMEIDETNYETIEGSIKVRISENVEEVEASKNKEVHVAVVVKQTAEMDDEMLVLIKKGQVKSAISLAEKQIEALTAIVEMDVDGKQHVAELLKQAKDTLATLKTQGATAKARKEIHHRGYMKCVDSADYASGYLS